ncbi:Eukaryotic aspartyl protease family protein [Euphorbia peplus]|nr:Eukaryotic aspartyl protease family protein [Euphorbia peplus]
MVEPKHSLLLLLLLSFLVFVLTNGVQCAPHKKQLLSIQQFQWTHNSINISSTCLSHKSRWEEGAAVLEMKNRDSCSQQTTDWSKKLRKRLVLDNLHVRSLQSQIRKIHSKYNLGALDAQIPLVSGIRLETLNYVVQVQLGGRNLTVIVDTGSDLTWVQCQPCKQCYNQKDPIFNPSVSPSYGTVSCNSTACQSLQFATGNSGICGSNPSTCNYAVNYGDGSYTRGVLGKVQLNFGGAPVENFVFGCGRNNRGLFGGASGLIGLGKSELSLVSQSSAIFGGVFSYCLPNTAADASGSLVLGGNSSVYKNSTPVSYTRMIPNPQLPTFYFLNLTGVSIGGVALQGSGIGQGGILIDSGTVITRLPPSLYRDLKAEFLKQFSGYPSAQPFSILDTCFNLSGYQEVNIPTISMHFEGEAELNVDVTGIFYFVKTDASQVCLALASLSFEDDIPILANYQQRNQRVIYDTKASMLGFAPEACSFN